MRTTHNTNLTTRRALLISGALLLLTGLFFAVAPVRQVAAARATLTDNPVVAKLLSYAAAPVQRVLGKRPASPQPKQFTLTANPASLSAPLAIGVASIGCTPDPVAAGATVTCTMTIPNDGVATGPLVVEIIPPAGVTMLNISNTSSVPAGNTVFNCGNVNPAGGANPGCVADNLPAAAGGVGIPTGVTQEVITFSWQFPANQACGTVNFTANIRGEGPTPALPGGGVTGPGIQGAAIPNNVNHSIDLSVTLTGTITQGSATGSGVLPNPAADTIVIAGPGIIQYTATVNNGGPSQAGAGEVLLQSANVAALAGNPNVSVSIVNAGATFAGCTVALLGGTGCPNALPFGPGAANPVVYQVTIGSAIPGGSTINMQASTSANNGGAPAAPCAVDPVAGNNQSVVVTKTIANVHDLTVQKSAAPGSTFAGGLIQYTINAANLGVFSQTGGNPAASSNAFGFLATDLLDILPTPAQAIAELISITPAANFTCTPGPGPLPFGGANAPNQVVCKFTGAAGLAPGSGPIPVAQIVVKVGANFDPADVIPDQVDNFAAIDADPADPGIRRDLNGGGNPVPNNLPALPGPPPPAVGQTQGNNIFGPVVTPIQVAADLGIVKISRTASASQPNQPQNSVIAGGTSIAPAVVGDLGNQATHGTADISYVLQFGNAGPGDARNVIIEDSIPGIPAAIVTASPLVSQITIGANTYNVTFNPVGNATTFSLVCGNYGIGNTFQCSPGDNTAINPSYVPGVLPRASSMQLGYRLRVLADAVPGTIAVNTARIASYPGNGGNPPPATPDPNAGNNTAQPTSNVIVAYADVAIGVGNKTTSDPAPVAGGPNFTYSVRVTNNGPSFAANVQMTDPLPAGIVFVAASAPAGSGFACTGPPAGTNGIVRCTNPNMPVGNTVITITAQAAANAPAGAITNTAQVVSTTPEPNGGAGNETGSVNQAIVVTAPLTILKTAGNATDGGNTVNAGENLIYTITVINAGPSVAQNVNIRDILPANLTYVSHKGDNGLAGACTHLANTQQIDCNNATLTAVPGTHNLQIVAKVNSDAPTGTITNTAAILNAGTGSAANPVATADITVLRKADLQITKDDSPDAVLPNGLITYTIKVKNIGPSDAGIGDFQVNEPVFPPTGTTLQGTITANGFNCNLGAAFPCVNTAPLPTGATATIQFTVKVDPNFNNGQPGGKVNNTANVQIIGAQIVDPNSNNNQANTVTPVGPNADLQLTKVAATSNGVLTGATVRAGGPFVGAIATAFGAIDYTLTYRNIGPGTAINAVITDVIPGNTIAVPGTIVVTPAQGAAPVCAIVAAPGSGNQIQCTVAALNIGDNGTITFRVRVPADITKDSIVKNQGNITSDTPDPNTSNNLSNETQNRVDTAADLSITKTDAPDPVLAGNNLTYTLTVNNTATPQSGSDAQNVTVTDTLPAGVTFVSATSTNADFNCNQSGGVVTCTAPKLAVGGSTTITIVVKVNANVADGTTLTNTATVSSATSDPNNANNTATATTLVNTDAAIAITKTDNPDPVVAGTNLTYSLTVTNNGPSDAQAFRLVDTLPAGVTFVSYTGTGVFSNAGACVGNNTSVTCNALPGAFPPAASTGVLPAGATANLTIIVKVNPDVPPNPLPQNPDTAGLTNTAVITWTDGTAATPNTATATQITTVRHESDMLIVKEAPDFVIAGQRMDYRLRVSNRGPSTVLGDATQGSVMVADLLPLGVTLADLNGAAPGLGNNPVVSPGGPGNFTCYANPVLIGGRQQVVCLNSEGAAGNFPAVGTIEIIIKVDTASNLTEGQNLVNCATVTLRDTNPTPEIDPLGGGQHNDGNTGVRPNLPVVFPTITTAASGSNESCDSTVVRTAADLGIAKSALPVTTPPGSGLPVVALPGPNSPAGSVAAGGYIRYDVPFGNSGPSDALNVMITDQIAGNTVFVGAVPTGGGFTAATTFTIQAVDTVAPLGGPISLTCTVFQQGGSQSIYCRPQGNGAVPAPGPYADGVLPAGYNGTLTFFVKVNESVSGGTIVANPANITSGLCPNAAAPLFPPNACASTADPNPGNNTSLATQTLVVSNSQLTISKALLPSPPNPPFAAVPPAAANSLIPGLQYTYRIVVGNNGPSDVANIRMIDTIPTNAKYVEIHQVAVAAGVLGAGDPGINFAATFTCAAPTGIVDPAGNGGQVQCTAPLMSANANNNRAAFEITIFVDPSTKANVTNRADVNGTLNNFNTPVSATVSVTNPVGPTSDIVLKKSHTNTSVDGLSVVAGTIFEYTIDVTNNGPSTAAMPRIIDIVPATQSIVQKAGVVPAVPDLTLPTGWTCTGLVQQPPIPAGQPNAGLVLYTVPAGLTCDGPSLLPNKKQNGDPNPAGTIQFKFKVLQDPNSPQPAPTFYDNCVTFQSMSFDPTTVGDGPANQLPAPDTTPDANGRFDNASVCDRVQITFVSPLTATKTDSPDPIIAGNLLTYVITGSPQGPSAALNFTISDALPQGTVFISATASAGATLTTPAVNANGTVTAIWNAAGGTAGGLTPVGTVRTLTIVVRVCSDFQQIRNLTDAQMCVPNLTNSANIFSATPPNLVGNPVVATATTTVQAQSNLSIAKSGPASANPNTVVTYTLTVANNAIGGGVNSSNANGVVVTDLLPKGFTLVPNSVTIAAGAGGGGVNAPAGNVTTATDAAGSQTVTINLGVVGTTVANGGSDQCGNAGGPIVTPRAAVVVITLQALVPKKHPNIIVTNTATVGSSNCLPETGTLPVQANPLSGFAAIITPGTGLLANNRAFFDTIIGPTVNDPGPGSVPGYPATAEISDQKAGSILIYPVYTSDAANPNAQNTRISMTNISSTEKATVHLFVVDGSSCSVLDAFICLTPNQTAAFLASDFDPGATGYIVAVAVDGTTGLPMAFNCLIGDEYVKFATGHAANLGAEGVAAVMMFPAGTNASGTTVNLNFNGMNYNALPRLLASDNIPSRADQNNTLMIVDSIGGNYTTSGATLGSLFGFLYDDAEVAYSYTQSTPNCQFRSQLTNSFPRIFNGFTNVIPAGRSGWMKLSSSRDTIGIIGAQINQNPNVAASSGAFNQGHNLHKLTLNPSVTLTVPIIPPACQ